jgi:hypothetical protein
MTSRSARPNTPLEEKGFAKMKGTRVSFRIVSVVVLIPRILFFVLELVVGLGNEMA